MAPGRARCWIAALVSLPAFSLPALAPAAVEAKRVDFGTLQDGTHVAAAELSNSAGMSVRIIALGAAIQSLSVPDRRGVREDVVLGHDSPREYWQSRNTSARRSVATPTALRAASSRSMGEQYTLETNDGPNHLHGGVRGLDKVLWKIDDVSSGSPARVVFSHVSPDGAGGYPGTLTITADLHAERAQRAGSGVPCEDGSADDRQHHQSHILQSRRSQRRRARSSTQAVR